MVDVTLVSVFLVGLLGGVHCAGMCGGIVSLIGARAGAERAGATRFVPIRPLATTLTGRPTLRADGVAARWAMLIAYNAGRIASYTLAGAIAGGIGSAAWLAAHVLPVQQVAFVVANALMIAFGLYLTGALRSVAAIEGVGRGLWTALQPLATRTLLSTRPGAAFGAGLVWGWVPCGMVYGVLLAALVGGSAAHGAALMLAFGLGTLPNLLALGWSAARLRGLLHRRGLKLAAGVLVIAFGIAGLMRIDPTAHLHAVVEVCFPGWSAPAR